MIETGNDTEAIDRMDEGQQYQFRITGTWDGASVALEEWSEAVGDFVLVRTFTANGTLLRYVMGNRARWVGSSVGGSTALVVENLRVKDTGRGVTGAGAGITDEEAFRQELGYSRPAASGALVDVADVTFTRVKADRQINPIPDEFVFLDTKFEAPGDVFVFTGAVVTPGTGLVITNNGGIGGYAEAMANKFAAPCCAVEMTINPAAASGAVQYIGGGITLRSATLIENYIAVFWNKADSTLNLEIKRNNSQSVTAGSSFAPTTTFKLLVLIYSNTVAALADTGNGWTLIHLFRNTLATASVPWNLRTDWDSNDFAPMVYGFATAGSFTMTRLRAGYAGHVGLQSLCHAKYEDGAPIIDEQGNYYMHATASLPFDSPGLASNWQHVHGMMFRVDPTTYKAVPTAMFFPYRDGQFRLDDAFGNIIFDRSTGRWNWLTQNASQLGAVNAAIINYYSDGNLLRGCHVLTDWHQVVMPGTKPQFDADAVKIEGTWYVAYSSRTDDLLAGVYFPALASSTALNGTFTAIGADPTQTDAEGLHFAKIGGTYYVCSFVSAGMLVYDLTMTLVDTIVPTGYSAGSPPHPHANILPVPVGNRTRYVLETFNRNLGLGSGEATYGDREIYESPLYEGNEFPVDSIIKRR